MSDRLGEEALAESDSSGLYARMQEGEQSVVVQVESEHFIRYYQANI